MLKILIINQFASAPKYSTGAGERHYYIAHKLMSVHFTSIISGSFNHLFVKLPPDHSLFNRERIEGGEFIWVRIRKYKSDNFIARAFSWFEFLMKLFFLPVKKDIKPDLVLVSSMSLWPTLYAWYVSKRYHVPFILEIRDIWPKTPVQLGNFSEKNPLIFLFSVLEKFAYLKADSLISLMPSFDKYLFQKLGYAKPVYWIPNAIDDSLLEEKNEPENLVRFNNNSFNVIYAGALGVANAMDCFIEAALILKNNKNIRFYIIGSGPQLNELKAKADGLDNISFLPKLLKHEVIFVIKQADACFISWKNLEMYNYGVSANKYNDYMLAAKPIISSSDIPDDPVLLANCGIQVPSGEANEIAKAIVNLSALPKEELELMGKNGYNYLIENNTYDVISAKYADCIQETIASYGQRKNKRSTNN